MRLRSSSRRLVVGTLAGLALGPLSTGATVAAAGAAAIVGGRRALAVLAGVACGLILQLLLNMLGLGFGLATLDPGTSDNPSAAGFGIGAAIWWVLSGLFAAFTGGWIAGRLAGKSKETTAGLHGVVSWAVTSLIVIYMLTSAVSGIVGGALGALGSAAGGIARTAGSAVSTAGQAAAVNPQASIRSAACHRAWGRVPVSIWLTLTG